MRRLVLSVLAVVVAGCGGGGTSRDAGGMSGAGGMAGAGGDGGRGGAGGPASCSNVDAAIGAGGSGGSATTADAGGERYSSDGPSSNQVFQSFCTAVRASMISRNERCVGMTRPQAEAVVGIDPCAAWGSALDSGRMAFDATKATSCAAALDALSCADDTPTACDGTLTGLVPDWAGAGSPGDCNMGRQLTPTGQTSPVSASLFTECVPGSFCIDNWVSTSGPRMVCRPRPRVGDVCTDAPLFPDSHPCFASVCDQTGHCAVAKLSGESCTGSADCAPGLSCGSNSTCAPKHPTGTCSPSAGECVSPATCDNSHCGVRARGGCCTALGQTDCAGGEYCNLAAGRCQTAPLIGQPCTLGSLSCYVGYCDITSGTCKVAAPGAYCGESARNASCGPNALCLLTGDQFACLPPGF